MADSSNSKIQSFKIKRTPKAGSDSRSLTNIFRRLGPMSKREKGYAVLTKCAELMIDIADCEKAIALAEEKHNALTSRNYRLQAKLGSGQLYDEAVSAVQSLNLRHIYEIVEFYQEYTMNITSLHFPEFEFPLVPIQTQELDQPKPKQTISKLKTMLKPKPLVSPIVEQLILKHNEKRNVWEKKRDALLKELKSTEEDCNNLQELMDYIQHTERTSSIHLNKYQQCLTNFNIVRKTATNKYAQRLLYKKSLEEELHGMTLDSEDCVNVEVQTIKIYQEDLKNKELEATTELTNTKEKLKDALEEADILKSRCSIFMKLLKARGVIPLSDPQTQSRDRHLMQFPISATESEVTVSGYSQAKEPYPPSCYNSD